MNIYEDTMSSTLFNANNECAFVEMQANFEFMKKHIAYNRSNEEFEQDHIRIRIV